MLGLLRETEGNGGQALRELDARIREELETQTGA
jgi:hypothetical protein